MTTDLTKKSKVMYQATMAILENILIPPMFIQSINKTNIGTLILQLRVYNSSTSISSEKKKRYRKSAEREKNENQMNYFFKQISHSMITFSRLPLLYSVNQHVIKTYCLNIVMRGKQQYIKTQTSKQTIKVFQPFEHTIFHNYHLHI